MGGGVLSSTEGEELVQVHHKVQEYVLNGVSNRLFVLFKIETGKRNSSNNNNNNEKKEEKEEVVRPPLNISVVLDRSGSMQGDRLEHCKKGIHRVIDLLHPNDKFHLITYDDNPAVVIENSNLSDRQALKNSVDAVRVGGCTNLEAGLVLGHKTLKPHVSPDVLNNRIFIFSDGIVNVGKISNEEIFTSVKEIQRDGVNVTSFGIGADFNEVLMKGIAEHGKGIYFFIDSEDNILPLVDKAFSHILELVGASGNFKVRGKNGAVVKQIVGYSNIVAGASLGDLVEDDLIQVLVEVEVSPTTPTENQFEFLSYELSYLKLDSKNNKNSEITGTVSIRNTNNEKLIEEDKEVVAAYTMAEVSQLEREIAQLLRDENFERAIEIKQDIISKLTKVESWDESGVIKLALARAIKNHQEMIDNKKDSELMAKDADYLGYHTSIVHRKCF